VQNPASAQYDGMRRSALAAGPVDFVLRPGEIASELARIGRHPFLSQSRKRGASEGEALSQESQGLERILVLLRNATGVEFARYKPATIRRRRIRRRMVLHRLANLGAYLRYLQSHPDEIEALQKDLLITVTHFFRQTEVLQALKKKVFPRLVKDRTRESKIRICVPGCSTGEEAYSLEIAFQEFLDDRSIALPAQIFAPARRRANRAGWPG
jgi:two-component system CheB/CheR fusion protein